MRLRSLASLRPWLYPYNIEIIYIPISIIYYLVSYYGTVFLCINLLLTFTVIQPAAAKVINKQIIIIIINNDVPECLKYSTARVFADDTTITNLHKSTVRRAFTGKIIMI